MILEEQWARAQVDGSKDLEILNEMIRLKDDFQDVFNKIFEHIVVIERHLEKLDDIAHPSIYRIEGEVADIKSILNSTID